MALACFAGSIFALAVYHEKKTIVLLTVGQLLAFSVSAAVLVSILCIQGAS